MTEKGDNMNLKVLDKKDLPAFVENMTAEYEVFGPVAKDFKFEFARTDKSSELRLDYNTTLLPPKTFVTPPHEELITFALDGEPHASPVFEEPRRVVFGAHSCDLHGIWLLDDLFAEGVYDPHYFSRRRGTYFIGIDCKEPCWEHSFCKSMGTLKPGGGYEMFLTDLGDMYAVQVAGKGEDLLCFGNFRPADYELRDRFFETWREKLARFPDRVGYDTERLPVYLAEAYDDIIWDALEERCFDCGACTVVCPTCYCFDVYDTQDAGMKTAKRCRRWDSCQLRNFAAVAGGENFRGKRSDRLRHRLFRKGKYFKEWYDRFACVGCGRCGRACLVKIDVLEIFRQIGPAGEHGLA